MSKKDFEIPDYIDFEDMMERFFSGEMKKTEREHFLYLIENDDELKEDFEMERSLTIYTKMKLNPTCYKSDIDLFETMEALEKEFIRDEEDDFFKDELSESRTSEILNELGIFKAWHRTDGLLPP